MDSPLTIVAIIGIMLAGWLAGGLANLAADRLPLRAPTAVPLCRAQHFWTLPWYFRRNGHCPACGAPRPWRAPALEMAFILVFIYTAWHMQGEIVQVVAGWFCAAFLLTVSVIDFEHRRVLNTMLAPAAVLLLGLSLLPQGPGLASALLGGAVGFGLFWLLHLGSRGALGAGDVKLAGVLGLMLGYPAIVQALMLAAMLAAAVAVGLLISRRATLHSSIAYAPYLAIGALLMLWFGKK